MKLYRKKWFRPERTRTDADTVFEKNRHVHQKNFGDFLFSILTKRKKLLKSENHRINGF